MKHYIIKLLTSAFLIFALISCGGKNDNPAPTDNGNNNTGGTGNNGGTISGTFGFDPSFKSPTGFSSAHAFEQADGKIIIDAYSTVNSKAVIKLYRLNTDGGLDNSFNIDVDKSWLIKSITGIFVLADGKILIGGEFTVSNKRVTVIRLTSAGALDYTYVSPGLTDNYLKVWFQRTANGKVLVAYVANGVPDPFASIIRLNSDGTLDTSFSMPIGNLTGSNDAFTSIVPLANGQIMVAGTFSISSPSVNQHVARINADGSLDQSFNFKYAINQSADITKIGVQSNGKIIIVGTFNGFTDPAVRDASYTYYGVARLNGDGTIDQTFKSSNGITFSLWASDAFLLSDDRVVVSWLGVSNNSYYGQNYIELFSQNGGLDSSLNFSAQYSSIVSNFKEKADQFLLVGSISMNGTYYPVVRFKKNS